MSELAPAVQLSLALDAGEARRLTDEVKRDVGSLREKLLRLYEGAAHVALGYASWRTYWEAEFESHWRTGYRELEAARVDRAIGPWANGTLPERQARELLPVLRDEGEAAVVDVWRDLRAEHGDEVTAERIRRLVRGRLGRARREHMIASERAAAEERAQAAGVSAECVVADIRTWRPGGVGAIITDPPYLGDVVPLYEALRDFAVDVLPDGGALVVMTGQPILVDVIRALEHERLVYRWELSWRYVNRERTPYHPRHVFPCRKPVLVYHAGGLPADAGWIVDELESAAPEKDHHEWGQSVEGFERLVGWFSRPGDVVCDPFLGGGTTAVAALAHARNFVGCDVDPAAVTTTSERLAAP